MSIASEAWEAESVALERPRLFDVDAAEAEMGALVRRQLELMMRGVEKQNAKTVTSALRGTLRDDPAARAEFLRLAQRGAEG